MNVRIEFGGTVDDEASFALEELADELRKADIAVEPERAEPMTGVRDGGLTIGLAIAGLAVSTLGTLVGVISYWRSTRPGYSVSITRGDTTVTVENLSESQIRDVIVRLQQEQLPEAILVRIGRN